MGYQANSNSIISAQAIASTGYRSLVEMGNTQLDTSRKINIYDFNVGDTVYWRVQSLDNRYKGSAFSTQDTLIIPLYIDIKRTDTVSICPQSYSLNIDNNYDSIGGNNLTYQWSPTIGLSSSTIRNPIASNIGTTTYYVTASSTEGWTSVDSFTVTLYAIPTANFSLPAQTVVDDTISLTYTGNASSAASYNWEMSSANIISGTAQGPYNLSWDSIGTKQLSLEVSENGCTSTLGNQSISVLPNGTIVLANSVCQFVQTSVSYIGSADTSAIYNWNFDGGLIMSGIGQGPYQIKWTSSGLKNITLTIIENGISSNPFTASIHINALPTFSITQNQQICLYQTAQLNSTISSGQTPISYLWSSSATSANILVSPIHDSVFYLTITDANGCENTDSTLVYVSEPFSNEEICLVTVDSAANNNIIVWEKTPNVSSDYFIIYKESTVINVYDSIGIRPYDSLGYFIDANSQPDIKSAKYKISVVDSCGNESLMSPLHRTMHLTINKGIGWTFNLIWTPYEGFQVQTYRIWRWNQSNGWTKIDSVSGGQTSFTDNPPNGLLYYFVEIVSPQPCNITKANTNYNGSRSNQANTSLYIGMEDLNDFNIDLSVYPNPYSEYTNITYNLDSKSKIKLEVYTTLGELVKVIVNETQIEGVYKYQFSAKENGFAKGIYLLNLEVDNKQIIKKLIEIK